MFQTRGYVRASVLLGVTVVFRPYILYGVLVGKQGMCLLFTGM